MVELWTAASQLQVQDTLSATFSTGCDCFPAWLLVRTLLSHILWKQYCSLPLKTFLYKIERDGFTTQGITQLKKQLTVQWFQIWNHQLLFHVSSIFFIRMRESEKLLLTQCCVFNITLQGNRSLFSGQLPGVMFFYLLRYLNKSAIISPTISNISHKNGQKVE